jgi:NAD(P)-dependent dehydrogenase (short-subunit alcohol dehydrogenase family)
VSLENRRVVVVGGSSGIGLATARLAARAGARVSIAGRSPEKLERAKEDVGGGVETGALDITREGAVRSFFEDTGEIDHLVLPGSSVQTGSLSELETEAARASMDAKFWGPYLAAKYARISPGGSITLFSGALSRRPAPGFAALAAINAAVEGLGRALALELAPVRVNVISPGLVATPAYAAMPEEARVAMYEGAAQRLPVGKVGTPEDIAETVLWIMKNGYATGAVIDVDGGGLLV